MISANAEMNDVVQRQVGKFAAKEIHNAANVIHMPAYQHDWISNFYSSNFQELTGSKTLTVRKWLEKKTFKEQHEYGIIIFEKVLKGEWRAP